MRPCRRRCPAVLPLPRSVREEKAPSAAHPSGSGPAIDGNGSSEARLSAVWRMRAAAPDLPSM